MKHIKRVLVVDDEEDLTWSISKNLAKDKDKYELVCVNSGKDALNVLNQVPVDLVISDIRMPEISGLDLLLTIKKEFPTTKVIIMTAYGSEAIQKEVYRRGSIAYIEKPFEIETLRQLILKNFEERKGFEGKVSDFQLTDIIQMNCLGRLTTALAVKNGSEEGQIFFNDGNITHAEVSGKEGEEAFYEILSWKGGEFSSRKGERSSKETIFKAWQSLLLEGMKRADEEVPQRDIEIESEKEYRIKKMEEHLKKIGDRWGVQSVVVFDKEGFAFASYHNPKRSLSLEVSELVHIGGKLVNEALVIGKKHTLGELRLVSVEYRKNMIHLFASGHSDYYMILLASVRTNEGAIRILVKKLMPQILEIL